MTSPRAEYMRDYQRVLRARERDEKEEKVKVKYCPKCKTRRKVSEFPKNRARKDGLGQYCRECDNGRGKGEHEHVYVRYGNSEPFCFKCYFAEKKKQRETRIPATDEAVRLRANLSRDRKGKQQ
jgi:hypothetical protein